jgi:transposase-like protein
MRVGQRPRPRVSAAATRAFHEARERDLLRWVRATRWGQGAADPPDGAAQDRPRNPPCPRCRAERTHRWGRFGNRQRWKCTRCGRTFSDLTGTFLQGTHRLAAWIAFADHLKCGPTVRAAAEHVGVNKDTALRWRHRLIDAADRALGPRAVGSRTEPGGVNPAPEPLLVSILPFPFDPRLRPDQETRSSTPVSWVLLGNVGDQGPSTARRATAPGAGPGAGAALEWTRLAAPQAPPIIRILACRGGRRPSDAPAFRALESVPVGLGPLTADNPDAPLVRRYCHPRRRPFLWRIMWGRSSGALRARRRALRHFMGSFKAWQRRFRGFARANLYRYLAWYRLWLGSGTLPPLARSRAGILLACCAADQGAAEVPGPP